MQGFRAKATVKGLDVDWQVMEPAAWQQQLQQQQAQQAQRRSSHQAAAASQPEASGELAVDFGTMQLHGSCQQVVVVTNRTSMVAEVSAWACSFPAAAHLQCSTTARSGSSGGMAASGTGAAVAAATASSAAGSRQRQPAPLRLQDRSLPGLAPFTAVKGNAMMDTRRALAASAAALGGAARGMALDVQVQPGSGRLASWGSVAVLVTVHADMPGEYTDTLCIQVRLHVCLGSLCRCMCVHVHLPGEDGGLWMRHVARFSGLKCTP